MTDKVDAWWSNFLHSGREQENILSHKIPICDRLADFYNTSHRKRGVALIFNQETFDDPKYTKREGTNKDCVDLSKVLSNLEFDLRVFNNYKYGQIHQVLQEVSEEDHSHSDCLFICVMSHGEDGKISASDHTYPPDILWTPFTGDKCITLAGKPKLFFIQACRGCEVDPGAKVKERSVRTRIQSDSAMVLDEPYTIPAMADILVMYSTYQGYYSWRSPDNGSWFIQALCAELSNKTDKFDLVTILTFVNRRIAIGYESNVPLMKSMNKKKQICTIVSMLTRLVIFPPKSLMESASNETKN